VIYKYDFTTDGGQQVFGYLKQFFSLLVRDASNPRTLDFFSEVAFDQTGETEWRILCYVSGAEVPAIELIMHGPTQSYDYRVAFAFNGTNMQTMQYRLVTSETEPADWQVNYSKYYLFDESTGTYIQRTAPDDYDYEPDTFYTGMAIDWYFGDAGFRTGDGSPRYGYLTSKGVMLINRDGTATVIAKTNNGKLALLTTDDSNLGRLAARYVVMGDADTIRPDSSPMLSFLNGDITIASADIPQDQQTSLAAITTHRTDIPSYLDGVYMLPQSQYRSEGVLSVGGDRYATNGYFALKE
jgi:hypothetical protein